MLLENHQQLHHTFFDFYIYQGSILLKKDMKKQLCYIFLEVHIDQEQNQIQKSTYERLYNTSLESYMIQEKFYCKRISINSFTTHFLSLIASRKNSNASW